MDMLIPWRDRITKKKKKLNNKKTKKKFEKSVRVSSGQGPGLNESSFGLCLLAAAVG